MTKLEDLGKVFTTDVLILGGGNSATVAAHRVLDQGLDVLCIDRHVIDYTGQSTKAGHGFMAMQPSDSKDYYMNVAVNQHETGMFLNDQEVLSTLADDAYHYIYDLERYGAKFAHEEDGSIHIHKEFPEKSISCVNLDLDYITPLIESAKKRGARMKSRVYFTDILTEPGTGRAVGAVGFDMDTLEFYIFKAKAVINCGNAFNFSPGGMFMMGADAQIAAYDAGAEFRNAEQCLIADLSLRNTENYIYGLYHLIENANGENVADKYEKNSREQLTIPLIKGMIKEVSEGRGPLIVDFSKAWGSMGAGWDMGREMPLRLKMDEWIRAKGGGFNPRPEVSISLRYLTQSLRVDKNMKTSVPGMWAAGSICMYGCAYGGWEHGDGVGFASRTGLRAGRYAALYAKEADFGEIDIEQVMAAKERVFAPLTRTEGILPSEFVSKFGQTIIGNLKYNVERDEASMLELIDVLNEMKKDLDNMYVPQGDGHYLGKANECRSEIEIMKIILTASLARKETRGMAMRMDYPERDDENMLKWVIVTKGEDGEPHAHYERIPFERYDIRPPQWSEEWITKPVD